MTARKNATRGVTLVEMAVVVAVIAIVAALVAGNLASSKPRATLASVTTDLAGLLHGARQTALASGHDVIVMIFPLRTGKGPRVVVVEDPLYTFMSSATADPNFNAYDPEVLKYPAGGSVQVFDIPREIVVGPSAGMGSSLPAPLDTVTVSSACSFCSTDDAKNRRGAIRFDPRGSATFYSANAVARPSGVGASFTITNAALGQRNTFVILTSTGAVQVEQNG